MTHSNSTGKVNVQGETAEEFDINIGMKQGGFLSTILFNIMEGGTERHLPKTDESVVRPADKRC